MAYFAEIDSNNVVIRVLAACQDDIDANGGDQSEAAANHFQQQIGLTKAVGIKYIQTSEDGSFRKNFASPDFTYDAAKDAFIRPKKHPSWVLDETTLRYVPPVAYPETFDMHAADPTYVDAEGNPEKDRYQWNEETVSWDFVG